MRGKLEVSSWKLESGELAVGKLGDLTRNVVQRLIGPTSKF